MPPLRILLNGARGRMGQTITACAPAHNAVITTALDTGDSLKAATGDEEVVIDFSHHDATLPLVQWAAERRLPVVIGTTGHTEAERAKILKYAEAIPLVWSGNYSVGVNLLYHLVERAAAVLKDGYDPEVIEMHHRHKKDAPSGTAEGLLNILRAARALSPEDQCHGRHGLIGARPANEIGVHAIRGGDIVGEHTVLFAGDGERIELTHKASDRRIFADGAIRAAQWACLQQPGLYSMQNVLQLT